MRISNLVVIAMLTLMKTNHQEIGQSKMLYRSVIKLTQSQHTSLNKGGQDGQVFRLAFSGDMCSRIRVLGRLAFSGDTVF